MKSESFKNVRYEYICHKKQNAWPKRKPVTDKFLQNLVFVNF